MKLGKRKLSHGPLPVPIRGTVRVAEAVRKKKRKKVKKKGKHQRNGPEGERKFCGNGASKTKLNRDQILTGSLSTGSRKLVNEGRP